MRGMVMAWVFTGGAAATTPGEKSRSRVEFEGGAIGVGDDEGAGAQLAAVEGAVLLVAPARRGAATSV